ncbi:MAG: rhomboid family intramembrane serine protease [Chthoniobacterales bacterium]
MLDLNHILLFIATISPLVLIVRTFRGGIAPSWRYAALGVLAITALVWFVRRDAAGLAGGSAWFLLLFFPATTLRKAADLARQGRFGSARRLVSFLRYLPVAGLREHTAFIDALDAAQRSGHPPFPAVAQPRRTFFARQEGHLTPAVVTLIALNLAMFLAEISLGGSTSFNTLHRLGALEPYAVLTGHEYWRLVTAPFLHYGTLHLFLNLFALYFFGQTLERAIGATRFAVTYLIAGIGSCAEVALLWRSRWLYADQLVGASGAVMGVVGAWAGVLLRDRHAPLAQHRLRNIVMIVLVQTTFDLVTPQVSMAAHLGGFATGLVVGLIIAPKTRPAQVAQ